MTEQTWHLTLTSTDGSSLCRIVEGSEADARAEADALIAKNPHLRLTRIIEI